MAVLATFNPSPTGATAPTFTAASAGGDKISNPGQGCIAIVKNTSGASITATFVTPGNMINGVAVPDLAVSVPATTGERWVVLGSEYADANNQCDVTYSATASVTIAVVKL